MYISGPFLARGGRGLGMRLTWLTPTALAKFMPSIYLPLCYEIENSVLKKVPNSSSLDCLCNIMYIVCDSKQ